MHLLQRGYKMSFDKNLFVNYWHLVCHKSELLNDSDYVKFDTPIGEVVIFNDMGNVVAFDNKCPHRGTKIYQEDHGNRIASCPYHRWAYRNSKMIVPDKERFVGCDIENANINKYQTEWCGDFLFIGIEPRFKLHEQFDEITIDKLKRISASIDKRRDFNRYDFECYWAIGLENALELYHVPVVHPKSLGKLDLGSDLVYNKNSSTLEATIGNTKMKKQLLSLRKFFDVQFQYEGFMAIYLFPFTTITSTFGYSYGLQHFLPSTKSVDDITKFTSRIFSSKVAKPEFMEFLEPFFKEYYLSVRQVFEEDHAICKLTPKESWSLEPFKYASQMEQQILYFRELCRNAEL